MALELLSNHPEQPPSWDQTVEDYLNENGIRYTAAAPLQGGHSAYVWRIDGCEDVSPRPAKSEPCVLKYADGAAKGAPQIALDTERMSYEARALTSGPVAMACAEEPSVQVPSVFRTTDRAMLMSWGGEMDLRTAYIQGRINDAGDVGSRLGRWLACLHKAGVEDERVFQWTNRVLDDFDVSEEDNFRKTLREDGISEGTIESSISLHKKTASVRTLAIWDFRPMNTLLRFSRDPQARPDLTIVDWECANYACPVSDLRIWVAEALVLEKKYGKGSSSMVSEFLAGYTAEAGSAIVTMEFVCKLAVSVGSILFMLVPSALWGLSREEQDMWKGRATQFVRAGTSRDMAWLASSEFSPIVDSRMLPN